MRLLPFILLPVFVILSVLIRRLFKSHPRWSAAIGNIVAVGFFLAFAVMFGGGGILLFAQGMQKHDLKLICFSIPFLLIGAVAVIAFVCIAPMIQRQARLKAAHPNEPWLWDADWATGQIPNHAMGGAVGSWLLAIVVNCISTPAVIVAMQQYSRTHDNKTLIAWLFPAIGIALIVLAIRATIQAAYFGKSILSLQTLPASPGGALVGTIHLTRALLSPGPIRLHLVCLQEDRSDKHSSQATVWEDEQQLDRLPSVRTGTDIPVYFTIPRDAQVTTDPSKRLQITWRLEVTAATAEVNYRSRFTVPIFQLGNPVTLPPVDPAAMFRHHETHALPVDLPGITLTRLADGGCVLHFAPARNPGAALFVTALAAILCAIVMVEVQADAPLLAEIVTSMFALITCIGTLNAWLGSATITVRPKILHIERGMPLLRRHRDIPAETISQIVIRYNSQLGKTVYYSIMARRIAGEAYIVGPIRGKHNADDLAAEMNHALGLDPTRDSMTATP